MINGITVEQFKENMYKEMYLDFKKEFLPMECKDEDSLILTVLFFQQLHKEGALKYLDGYKKVTDTEQMYITKILNT